MVFVTYAQKEVFPDKNELSEYLECYRELCANSFLSDKYVIQNILAIDACE